MTLSLFPRVLQLSLALVLGGAAHAVEPQACPGPARVGQLGLETAYMYGLADRINTLLGNPEDRTAMDLKLSRAGMNVSSVRRSLFAFLASPWCWISWPPISRLEYLANVMRISVDDLVRPDLLAPDFGLNSRFSVAGAQRNFQGYIVLALKYDCTRELDPTPRLTEAVSIPLIDPAKLREER